MLTSKPVRKKISASYYIDGSPIVTQTINRERAAIEIGRCILDALDKGEDFQFNVISSLSLDTCIEVRSMTVDLDNHAIDYHDR